MSTRMRTFQAVAAVAVLASLLATACGGGAAPAPSEDPVPEPGISPQAELTVDLEPGQAVSSVVPATGGELTTVGSDGTRYTLTIPEGALLTDTYITMTPIASIADFPFSGGLGGAVQLEPEGLYFYEDVILTIDTAQDIPLENQVFFGFNAESDGLYLASPVVESADIQIRLQHFSGAGVGNGVSAEKAAVLNRIADRTEARIQSEVADYLSQERQKALLGSEDDAEVPEHIREALQDYFNNVVKNRIKAALADSATCEQGRRALQTYFGYERQRQLLGVDDDTGIDVNDLLLKIGRKCLDEAYQECLNEHIIHKILPFWLGFERQKQLLGLTDDGGLSEYGMQLVEQCLRFEVKFESSAQFDGYEGEGSMQSRVTASVPMRFTFAGGLLDAKLEGQGPLVNTNFSAMPFDEYKKPCSVDNRRGGGEFSAFALVPVTQSKGEDSVVVDVVLVYDPGQTSESYTATCERKPDDKYSPKPPPQVLTVGPAAFWTAMYVVTHQDEIDRSGQYSSAIEGVDLGGAPGAPGLPPVPNFIDPNTGLPDLAAMQAYAAQLEGAMSQEGGANSQASQPPFMMMADSLGGALIAKGWSMQGGELYATLDWDKENGEAYVIETGSFKLYHRPGK